MTDATEYGVESQEDSYILNQNPPGVTKDYVKDNGDKIAEEIMPDTTETASAAKNKKNGTS